MVENIIVTNDGEINKQIFLDTLDRFGLIRIKQNKNLMAPKYVELYNQFKLSETYTNYTVHLSHKNETLTLDTARVIKGSVGLTDLGKIFVSVVNC